MDHSRLLLLLICTFPLPRWDTWARVFNAGSLTSDFTIHCHDSRWRTFFYSWWNAVTDPWPSLGLTGPPKCRGVSLLGYLSMSVPAVVTKCRKLGSGVGCQIANIYFSWFWSLKVWNQVAGRFRVCCGLVSWSGESCLFSVSPGSRREWALWPMLMPPVCVCVWEAGSHFHMLL